MKKNMGFCSGCGISVISALLALLLNTPHARANSVLENMTVSVNSTSVTADSDGAKLDEEMSKPLGNMFLILRSGRKPRDGGELGSGLQEDEMLQPSAPSPTTILTEEQKLGLDSAETEHLLPEVSKKDLPRASTNSPWHENKMESTVFDLDTTHNSDPHEPPATVTSFPSHTEFLTVDFLDTRSRGNLVPASPTAHELQGREPTVWTIPDNHDYLTVSPSTEPHDYDEDLTTTLPPPPPRTFHPHFPNFFIPAVERDLPTRRDKPGNSGSVECVKGSALVNGTCRSQCDTVSNYCLNGGQCVALEGTGVFCRCNIQDYVWHKGARCESIITEFQVMCLAIGSSALTALLLFMIIVCFAKKLHVLKTENNKLRKRSSKYRSSLEQHNDNFSLSTIAEGSNPNDDPNSQNKLEDAVKSPPPKEDESLNIQNSLTPKHENHKVVCEENSSEVNSLQNNMM